MQILISIILLSLLILVHEFGHFGAALLFKVKVKEFSIFMGPKLLSFKTKRTTYSIRAIPIGGYVSMEGETEDSEDEDALLNKPKWQQAIIMLAGAFMNLLFGLIALIILTNISGFSANSLSDSGTNIPDLNPYISDQSLIYDTTSPVLIAGLLDGDKIISFNGRKVTYPIDVLIYSAESKDKTVEIVYERDGIEKVTYLKPTKIPMIEIFKMGVTFKESDAGITSQIETVSPDSPASKAGIKNNDILVSIDGEIIKSRDDVAYVLTKSQGKKVDAKLMRDGKEVDVTFVPEKVEQEEFYYNGLYFDEIKGNFFENTGAAFKYYISIIKSVYLSIAWLIQGKMNIKDAMGPVGIISTLGSVVASKDSILNIFKQLLSLMGLISINLGFVNLLPFPALDGSKLVILGIEAIRRKKIPIEKQAIIAFVGFVILIILLIGITSLDVIRIFGK